VARARGEEHLQVTISDQGPGIANELKGSIFEEFSDADPEHHTAGQRLSLALSREIVTAHEGDLALLCGDAGATTFGLMLPIAGPATRPAESHQHEEAAQASLPSPMRIAVERRDRWIEGRFC